MAEQVNHPAHYQRTDGIECLDIIRYYTCDIANAIKYLWRAGLKPEMGKDEAEKEVEDLCKGVFYVEDYRQNVRPTFVTIYPDLRVQMATGHAIEDIVSPYPDDIKEAMKCLLRMGIIDDGLIYEANDREAVLNNAVKHIRHRIQTIQNK